MTETSFALSKITLFSSWINTSSRRVHLSGSATVSAAPLDSAEPGVAKQSVNKADGSHRLVTVGPVGILRIPDGRDVLDPEGVTAVNANGESHVQAVDGLPSPGSSPPMPVK